MLDIVWMAGLAARCCEARPWSRWTMPFRWSVLIGGWALALSLAWPVIVAREIGFRLRLLTDTGAINSVGDDVGAAGRGVDSRVVSRSSSARCGSSGRDSRRS